MGSNAPGQLAGYMLQIPRALARLLEAGEGSVVSIEVVGDVGWETEDGKVTTEEDKASVNSNPVSDRSINLWKTFYNWIKDIEADVLDVKKTEFILFSNKSGKVGIVDQLSAASSEQEVSEAVENLSKALSDISQNHDIWKFFSYAVNDRWQLFCEVVSHFKFQAGSANGADEVLSALKLKHASEAHLKDIYLDLLGWISDRVSESINNKQQAKITWEEFNKKAIIVFSRYRSKELIDFASKSPPSDEDIDGHFNRRRLYVQQLEAIELDQSDIIEAITHYLNAGVNRAQWIETGIIDDEVANDLEKNLLEFWKNRRGAINITNKDLSENEKGKLLLLDCSARQQLIRGESPPASTIAGTYHLLADEPEPELGWHSDWEDKFKAKNKR